MVGIFSKESNVYRNLQELEPASESSHKIFDEFLDSLSESGLRIAHVVAQSRKDSHCGSSISNQREPTLGLYIADRHSFAAMGVDEHDSNWSLSYPGTKKIVENWSSLCEKFELTDEYYSPTMLVFIYNLKTLQLNELVRSCKPLVEKYFEDGSLSRSDMQKPSYIFVSSEPAIRVFYRSPKELRDEGNTGNISRHKQAIKKILTENDKYECYESDLLTIEFLDCETESSNMYGYFRED